MAVTRVRTSRATRTRPLGDPMQVQVLDAATPPQPRAGIEITLSLLCTPPDSSCSPTVGGANLTGPVMATSGAGGIATFNPASGRHHPQTRSPSTRSGFVTGSIPPARASRARRRLSSGSGKRGSSAATTHAPFTAPATTTRSTRQSMPTHPRRIRHYPCSFRRSASIVPPSMPQNSRYEYTPLSAQVVAWKYTGRDADDRPALDKTLVHQQTDRGTDLDFCFTVEGNISGTNTPSPSSTSSACRGRDVWSWTAPALQSRASIAGLHRVADRGAGRRSPGYRHGGRRSREVLTPRSTDRPRGPIQRIGPCVSQL